EATARQQGPQFDYIEQLASECFMPVGYGGGVCNLEDMKRLFQCGVEKVVINSAANDNPGLIREAADTFGSQSVLVSIDVKRKRFGRYAVYTHSGTKRTDVDPVDFALQMEALGTGEILLNSIDQDGVMKGYDIDILRRVTNAVRIPVVACGGAGRPEDLKQAIFDGGASAAGAGSLFVFRVPERAVLVNYPSREKLEELFPTDGSGSIRMERQRVCTRCIMDTTDPEIEFDEDGVCNHCEIYDTRIRNEVFSGEDGKRRLAVILEEIKRDGKGKKYDCIIGVSGGVDSTYVAYKVKEFGLRPLAVHLDNGWNSEIAVRNINNTLEKLGIDLHTHVIDWEEFKDLQLSFLRASTPDSEIPTDHAINSVLHEMAEKLGVKHLITGHNIRTECHLPTAWSVGHADWKYIREVHRRFGSTKLTTYPHAPWLTLRRRRFSLKRTTILNYLDFDKKDALQLIQRELGWQDYGGKHFESIYTRFYQGYILPTKWGYDKRRAHLSTLVCSRQITREQALEEMESHDAYPEKLQDDDREYVIKKFEITDEEFDEIMNLPRKSHWEYPSYGQMYDSRLYGIGRSIYRKLGLP
ncbi:MAG: N-acetyl sugar amidotransferase, partial [Myxococcota bacterium]